MTVLKLSSAVHLVLEFLLGFGGAVLVLEQSHQRLAIRNDALAADNARFRDQAERDALTSVYNRHAFFQMLDVFRVAEFPVRGCVAMVDIDGLKQLNDTFGHALGDSALIRVAQAVRQLMAEDDRLFRWGGDEFLLVAFRQNAATVVSRLDQLNVVLATPDAVTVQVSFGVVEFGAVGELSDAVRRADLLMYARRRERSAPQSMIHSERVDTGDGPTLAPPGGVPAAQR
jgi:diguanylate cyclase (GGDEF)-like protein